MRLKGFDNHDHKQTIYAKHAVRFWKFLYDRGFKMTYPETYGKTALFNISILSFGGRQ